MRVDLTELILETWGWWLFTKGCAPLAFLLLAIDGLQMVYDAADPTPNTTQIIVSHHHHGFSKNKIIFLNICLSCIHFNMQAI